MREKLRNYIEKIFEDAPKSVRATELKEEILQNLLDKYDDLLKEGKNEEAAFNLAVANIGDVSELLDELSLADNIKKKESIMSEQLYNEQRKKSALFTSIAILLYCTCVVPIFIFQSEIGVIFMFVFIGAATALLVYDSKLKTSYKKSDDTVVEEFKEWKKSDKGKKSRKSIHSAIWTLILVIYFIVSFETMAWHITWLLFIIGEATCNIADAAFELRN